MRKRTTHAAEAQRGISIVEVLVALVVMSVGMLGIAGLYVASLRANRTALTRTHVVSLANDMADRIRANPSARGAYSKASYTPPQPHNCTAGANCSAAELAEDDLATWSAAIADVLPGNPAGDVQFTPAAGAGRPDWYLIQLSWLEAGASQNFTYLTNVQLIPVTP